MTTPVLFLLGAGPKIGLAVANAFATKGYKVALAARSLQDGVGDDGYLRLHLDLGKTADIPKAFAKVTKQFGTPSVVVYNAAYSVTRDYDDPFASMSIEEVEKELAINSVSVLFAAHEAVNGFKKLPSSASKTFIMTGNMLNVVVKPSALTFGMGKVASAHMIESASVAYAPQGFKFYYADERQANGGASIPVSGPAAAEAYVELAEKKEQGPWKYTFVLGKGYVEFEDVPAEPLPADRMIWPNFSPRASK